MAQNPRLASIFPMRRGWSMIQSEIHLPICSSSATGVDRLRLVRDVEDSAPEASVDVAVAMTAMAAAVRAAEGAAWLGFFNALLRAGVDALDELSLRASTD